MDNINVCVCLYATKYIEDGVKKNPDHRKLDTNSSLFAVLKLSEPTVMLIEYQNISIFLHSIFTPVALQ